MLQEVENIINSYIDSLNDLHVKKLFNTLSNGKMLRSKLILNIASSHEECVKLCAIVELIHLASLLHDDVIDESQTRRGKSSFNANFGDKNAIMLGDILYSKAFYELNNFDVNIAKQISNTVVKLSIGEMMDVKMSEKFNNDKNLYYDMIYKKTASLIESCAVCAAMLTCKDVEKYSSYGKNLGLAFQIIDDILDITGDEKTLGKPALNDYKEGKTTLPYIYLHESLDKEDKKILESYFKKGLNEHEILWIKDKFKQTNALNKSINEAKQLGHLALTAIKDENMSELENVVNMMIQRDF